MKTNKLTTNMKSVFVSFSTLTLIFLLLSCTPKIPFETSTVTPAAEGYIKLKTDKNMNYEIQINVSNLAEIDKLQPIAHVYVAWIVTEQDSTKNIGGLISSNKLNVVFKTVSSSKPVQVMISAEKDANVLKPIGQVVLTTSKFWD